MVCRPATAIQHVCMAKALIREHDLRVMNMGLESDRQVSRAKVRFSRIFSLPFKLAWCLSLSPTINLTDDRIIGRGDGKLERSLWDCAIGGRWCIYTDRGVSCSLCLYGYLFFCCLHGDTNHTRTDNETGGSWITDPQAQTFLLDLLRRTETEHGWPWTFLMQKLSQDWHLTVRWSAATTRVKRQRLYRQLVSWMVHAVVLLSVVSFFLCFFFFFKPSLPGYYASTGIIPYDCWCHGYCWVLTRSPPAPISKSTILRTVEHVEPINLGFFVAF